MPRTLVFVTHDRVFLQRLATRIVEVERARLFDWTCDYTTFLARKEAALEAEAQQEALFDKKLAQEEVWIRQGVKARRTRNEGRVRALERMREERRDRRTQMGNVRLQVQDTERSGNIVIAAKGISHGFGGTPVLEEVTTTIYRGDKVGILGPNGCGKTTLLRILLGELPPERGTVRLGTNLQMAYFDQLRAQLDEEKSADGKRRGRQRDGAHQRPVAARARLPARLSCFRANGPAAWCGIFREASGTGCCWRGCSRARQTCWSWTSRRTIWMPKRSNCSKLCWWTFPARSCSSATTVRF